MENNEYSNPILPVCDDLQGPYNWKKKLRPISRQNSGNASREKSGDGLNRKLDTSFQSQQKTNRWVYYYKLSTHQFLVGMKLDLRIFTNSSSAFVGDVAETIVVFFA